MSSITVSSGDTHSPKTNIHWTDKLDSELFKLKEEGLRWALIAKRLPKTEIACRKRYSRLKKKMQGAKTVKKEIQPKWSTITENRLKELVKLDIRAKKIINWEIIAENFPCRDGDDCMEKYLLLKG